MFQSVQRRSREDSAAVLDIAPLIDIVFILLIFFLVTTTFVRDRGIDVVRPQATHTESLQPEALRVHITAAGNIFVDGDATRRSQVPGQIRTRLEREPRMSVIVVADEQVPSKSLIDVIDRIRAGGASDIALATQRREGPG